MTQTGAGDSAGIGPLLYFRGYRDGRLALAVLVIAAAQEQAPALTANGDHVSADRLYERAGHTAFGYRFTLPARADTGYSLDGTWYPVNAAVDGDLRIGFVSCDGQEEGDMERDPALRNRLWQRLAGQHNTNPLQLLLQGGDQLYADEILDAHPAVRRWAEGHSLPGVDENTLAIIQERLREALFARYLYLYRQHEQAWVMARVPSLCVWDDHDICDGWGSLPERQLDHPIGRALFSVARELYLLFQFGTRDSRLPALFHDPGGTTLSWSAQLPGVDFVGPDLRSERRPNRVMGAAGWGALDTALAASDNDHVFVLSSVPGLGPRLSWGERLLHLLPHMQKYEDDLRDQWQSRAHREEWRRFLGTLLQCHEAPGSHVTLLSGEIHLATRATMASDTGDLHQLIASGISHPPPPLTYARSLGALARLGEAPLPNHPIRLHPLPGRKAIYTAQRNYLMLTRTGDRWHAWWELEDDGATPALALTCDD